MTINEALDYIHAVDWRRSSLGLSRIDELLAQMGHPERTMKFVHVTGTNGKGSTCAILASVLRAAGYRTGLYTSPYIFRFNERMQIDGVPISDAELCAVTEEVRPLADGMADHPTEFEMVTAIAFSWFASRKCDIVVCEVGMGGELDATNVIPAPEAAVLCNIGLDHTAYLGRHGGEDRRHQVRHHQSRLRRCALPLCAVGAGGGGGSLPPVRCDAALCGHGRLGSCRPLAGGTGVQLRLAVRPAPAPAGTDAAAQRRCGPHCGGGTAPPGLGHR